MTLAAGSPKRDAQSFDDVETVCAIDGDGTALCDGRRDITPVDGYSWPDTPDRQRCAACAVIMAAGARHLA